MGLRIALQDDHIVIGLRQADDTVAEIQVGVRQFFDGVADLLRPGTPAGHRRPVTIDADYTDVTDEAKGYKYPPDVAKHVDPDKAD